MRQLDVLEFHVDLVGANLYGAVKAGYLRVAGRLTTAKIVLEKPAKQATKPTLLLPDTKGSYKPVGNLLNLSWGETEISEAIRRWSSLEVLYTLAVLNHLDAKRAHLRWRQGHWQKDPRRSPNTRCLVLAPVENRRATFRRCGSFVVWDEVCDRFDEACLQFDSELEDVPFHSFEDGYGSTYVVTLIWYI